MAISKRRAARAGYAPTGARNREGTIVDGVPWELTADGLSAPLWRDDDAVARWLARHDLTSPSPHFWGHPRALRDHCAERWAVKAGRHVSASGAVDWHHLAGLDVPAPGPARVQARFSDDADS